MAAMGQLNVTNIINLITFVAIILPIIYFIMMISSKKVTKVERSRVIAYMPLFVAAAIFWGLKNPVPWSWPCLPNNGRCSTLGLALCRR